jgi:hypothetical protein
MRIRSGRGGVGEVGLGWRFSPLVELFAYGGGEEDKGKMSRAVFAHN